MQLIFSPKQKKGRVSAGGPTRFGNIAGLKKLKEDKK